MIYFAINHDNGLIKIGHTTDKSVSSRVSQLQGASGYSVELLYEMPGDEYVEVLLHQKFSDLCEVGEWFRNEGELKSLLDSKGNHRNLYRALNLKIEREYFDAINGMAKDRGLSPNAYICQIVRLHGAAPAAFSARPSKANFPTPSISTDGVTTHDKIGEKE